MPHPERLHHKVPGWVEDGSAFHIRIRAAPGCSLLAGGAGATAILDSAQYYHLRRHWFCRLILVMPDHLHAILAFPRDSRMSATIGAWKSFLAKGRKLEWQDGFFDHRLRSRKEADECWRYIRQNPVRAGLVAEEANWPWVWWPPDATIPG